MVNTRGGPTVDRPDPPPPKPREPLGGWHLREARAGRNHHPNEGGGAITFNTHMYMYIYTNTTPPPHTPSYVILLLYSLEHVQRPMFAHGPLHRKSWVPFHMLSTLELSNCLGGRFWHKPWVHQKDTKNKSNAHNARSSVKGET